MSSVNYSFTFKLPDERDEEEYFRRNLALEPVQTLEAIKEKIRTYRKHGFDTPDKVLVEIDELIGEIVY